MKYLDKDGLTHLWAKIKAKIPTKTSQLTNDSGFSTFSGSYNDLTNKPTIPTVNNATLTIQKNGTNVNTFTANASSNVTANITVPTKTSEITNDSNYLVNSNSYMNIHPENSPVIIPFIHNDIAFLTQRGGSRKIYYDGVEQNLDISNVFDGSGSYWAINPTGTTTIIIELTLHKTFTWTSSVYIDFGSASWRAKSVKIEVMNTNYSSDVWTQKYNTTTNGVGGLKATFSHTPVGASNAGGGFNKLRFTFSNWNTANIFRISQLGVYNYGSQGVRETYMSRGLDDEIFRNITPSTNNTYNLGSSSKKWANAYATTFTGNLTGTSSKATGDKNGNDITTTYATKTELNNLWKTIYPVGSIYISTSSTNPQTYLGGTWVAFGTGRTLVGIDTSDNDFKTVEKTGGSKAMQSHYHDIRWNSTSESGVTITNTGSGDTVLNIPNFSWGNNTRNAKGSGSNLFTNTEGTGTSGNLQPYITVYMWKRTA